ncbi:putative quinol monooxygenase [Rhizosphaericola mali]|uniref:Antibiotic biosynthesis monooxygenase n=1 Tax=Rhizosphaericola mali TaxID=2545455 RepID=A0A5P2G5N4_9BACT|nr:putative quinol monooxygenase [Rhizosphaericola mali]QES89998.1 antibiotic biosynthesis monooxygenase [Rhizosphaericola mali]
MKDNIVSVFAKWQVAEGKIETVISLLKEAVVKSSAEEGNLKYEIFQEKENDHTILLFEQYINQEAADFHRKTPHFQEVVVQKILPLLEKREVIVTSEVQF